MYWKKYTWANTIQVFPIMIQFMYLLMILQVQLFLMRLFIFMILMEFIIQIQQVMMVGIHLLQMNQVIGKLMSHVVDISIQALKL